MRMNRVQPDGRHIIDRGMKPQRANDMRRPRLEPARRRGVGGLLEADPVDHRPATLIGRHGVEQFGPRPQHADAGRAVELMTRKDVEVAIQRGDIDGDARHRLAPVEQDFRADAVCEIGRATAIEHRAQHVRHMAERHQLVRGRQHTCHRIKIDAVILSQRQHVDRDAQPLGDHLPRHDVGVMLQHRQQDAIARLQVRRRPALRNKVDPLGCAAREDDLVSRPRADEPRRRLARPFIGDRHVGRALIDAAMHRGIAGVIGPRDRVDHGLRLLRGRGGIEIGPAVRDRRKIRHPVERRGARQSAASSQASASAAKASRTTSLPIRSIASATKARVNSACARGFGMPRLCM